MFIQKSLNLNKLMSIISFEWVIRINWWKAQLNIRYSSSLPFGPLRLTRWSYLMLLVLFAFASTVAFFFLATITCTPISTTLLANHHLSKINNLIFTQHLLQRVLIIIKNFIQAHLPPLMPPWLNEFTILLWQRICFWVLIYFMDLLVTAFKLPLN